MAAAEVGITIVTLASIVAFVVYVVGLLRLPTGHRPQITPMNRFGEPLPPSENPDYEETVGSTEA